MGETNNINYYSHLDLQFPKMQTNNNDDNLENQLIKKYAKQNSIIILNGNVIYNSNDSNIIIEKVNEKEYKSKDAFNALDKINKENLNSSLKLNILKNANEIIYIYYVFNRHSAHFSEYEINNGSNVSIYENFVLIDNAYLNYKIDVNVDSNANANIVSMQEISTNRNICFKQNFKIQDYSTMNYYILSLNSANVINETTMNLKGKYAKGNIRTLSYVYNNFEQINIMDLQHYNVYTTGNIYNIGIANDKAKFTIDATNKINKDMIKSSSEQTSKIINLSDTCKTVANPQLYIDNYDVQAGHSVAVGQIDEEQLYYLMSRGLTKSSATKLIVMGLADTVIENLEDNEVKNQFEELLDKKLN